MWRGWSYSLQQRSDLGSENENALLVMPQKHVALNNNQEFKYTGIHIKK